MGWRRLPEELEEADTSLVMAFNMLDTFRTYQAANENLEKLNQRGMEIYGEVEALRSKRSADNDG